MAGALVLAACAPFPEPRLVPTLFPPDEYATWYRELELCSGLKGDFGGIAFYTTTANEHQGHHFDGYWQAGGIVLNRHKLGDKELILHEMMHDLTRSGAHPREYFKGKCGDLSLGDVTT